MKVTIGNKLKKQTLLARLAETLGNVSEACRSVQISRKTFYEWVKTDPAFASAVNDIDEASIDTAESALKKQIRMGNITAIIFYLKTKGKERGYIEAQRIQSEVTMDVPNINLELVGGDDLLDDNLLFAPPRGRKNKRK